ADQLRFEQAGFKRGPGNPRLDFPYVAYEIRGFRAHARVEIRADAIFQMARLADVKQIAAFVAHQIDAGSTRQSGDLLGRDVAFDTPPRGAALMVIDEAIEPRQPDLRRHLEED